MIPGYWPGASGQATKLGIWPYLVVTMTSFSYMAGAPPVRQSGGAEPRATGLAGAGADHRTLRHADDRRCRKRGSAQRLPGRGRGRGIAERAEFVNDARHANAG